MALPVKIEDGLFVLAVDFATTTPQANDQTFVELDKQIRRLKDAADLKDLVITQTMPGLVSYTIEFVDGRTAAGMIDFSADEANPMATGTTTGAGWSVSEVQPFRAFRDSFIAAHNKLGAVGLSLTYV